MTQLAPVVSLTILLPRFISRVPAGFPSPAADHSQQRIDLSQELILHPNATFLFRVIGDSMIKVGIFDGDVILVDRAIEAVHDMIVLAIVDGEFTVKRLYKKDGVIRLIAENDDFPPIDFNEGQTLETWGVVTQSFRQHFVPAKRKYAKARS